MTDARLVSPLFTDKGTWLRGNLHVHTSRSDGRADPQETVARYASLGHDFLGLSDHDVYSVGDGLDPCGMLLLPGNEVSANGPHLLDVGAKRKVEPHPDRQVVIDAINATSGFAVLCHPSWMEEWNHYTFEMLMRFRDYVGIEIYNGLVLDQAGCHLATDKWDRLLSAGRLVWGFANDDAHRPEQAGRAWNVVRAAERTPEAILEALRTGAFYASTGVEIDAITADGAELHVVAPNADRIDVFRMNGFRVATADGPELRFDAADVMSRYIRVECLGRGGAMAWPQPILIRGGVYEKLFNRFAELEGTERPTLVALHAERAPEFTGDLSDPLWRDAAWSGNFLRMSDGEPSEVDTEVAAIASEGVVTLGVRCWEPRLDALRLKTTGDNLSSIWADDSVEVFLDTAGRGDDYIQVLVNAAGKLCVLAPRRGEYLKPGIAAKAGRVAGGWTVEVTLPLDVLGASTAPTTRWGFHVCRNRNPVRESLVWSWVGTGNHNPTRFGSLTF
ncbi:MAG TPA: CehA/McbA family metallohydrolase [Planctomycetota bacterium]|nr:CehA/McbA family metallohydrolase [Planctomycetota bacterium]